jgi:hypothetical protein
VRSIGTIMETLLRPTTRFRNSHPTFIHFLPEGWTEIELLPHLTPSDILATGVTWDEFLIFVLVKIVWMTPNVYVTTMFHMYGTGDSMVLALGANADDITLPVYVTPDTPAAVATATCDFLLRIFATSEPHDLHISGSEDEVPQAPPPLSGAAITLFFQESRDSLQKVTVDYMVLNEDQCRALATMSRLDVELDILRCCLADDAADAFVELFQSDGGPVNLDRFRIGSHVLANALTGDSRVTRLKPLFGDETDDADKAILFRALANNKGLVNLDLKNQSISDENLTILCQSLQAHPTLTSLGLEYTIPRRPAGAAPIFSHVAHKQKTRRTRVLAEMMQHNTVLLTIKLSYGHSDQRVYAEMIEPFLVTNKYRPRVHAIKKTEERPFREKVLGRAVYSVRRHSNLVWMLLSENVDAFVRSEEEEEEEEEESNSEVPVVAVAAVVAVSVAGSKRKR